MVERWGLVDRWCRDGEIHCMVERGTKTGLERVILHGALSVLQCYKSFPLSRDVHHYFNAIGVFNEDTQTC